MQPIDFIVLLLIAVLFFLALKYILAHKGGCSGCSKNCQHCKQQKTPKKK